MSHEKCEEFHEKIEEFKRNPSYRLAREIVELRDPECTIGYYDDYEYADAIDRLFSTIKYGSAYDEILNRGWVGMLPFSHMSFEEALYKIFLEHTDYLEIPRDAKMKILFEMLEENGTLNELREYYEEARKYHENLTGPYANFYRYVLYSRGQLPEGERPPITPEEVERIVDEVPNEDDVKVDVTLGNYESFERLKEAYRRVKEAYELLDRPTLEMIGLELPNDWNLEHLVRSYDYLPRLIDEIERLREEVSDYVRRIYEILEELNGMHPDGLRGLLSARSRGEEIENYEEVEEKFRELCKILGDLRWRRDGTREAITRRIRNEFNVDIEYICRNYW